MKNSVDTFRNQYIVFTGKLDVSRKEATVRIERMGGCIQSSVTWKTTILIIGEQDKRKLKEGHSKSLKHEEAETRIKKGQSIRIITKEHFYKLMNYPIQLPLEPV